MMRLETPEEYEHTKELLADLEQRYVALEARTDMSPVHWEESCRSYARMIAQFRAQLELYEAAHSAVANP
ncbi:MAG TPA: hypothetical protein VK137_13160 [Planctomycetaceae bacterium]|nr:hypothetical protein [Planctomycetaceae bacterium]